MDKRLDRCAPREAEAEAFAALCADAYIVAHEPRSCYSPPINIDLGRNAEPILVRQDPGNLPSALDLLPPAHGRVAPALRVSIASDRWISEHATHDPFSRPEEGASAHLLLG